MANDSSTDQLMLGTAEKALAVLVYTAIAIVALVSSPFLLLLLLPPLPLPTIPSLARQVGNCVVVFIVAYFRKLRTPTNLLILNLAAADVLLAIFCIPFSYITNLILVPNDSPRPSLRFV